MTSRSLRILLIVSLVLNMFLVGGITGAAIMWSRTETKRPLNGIGRPARLRQASEELQPDNRRALRQAVRGAVRSVRPQAQRARAARIEARELLEKPDFDRAAFDAALARARADDLAIRTRLEQSVIGVVATLPVEERRVLAKGLENSGALRMPRNRRGKAARAGGETAPFPDRSG
ncbi:periplasmic heavy metal sensor [Sphingomonas sanxanigenens]|uniref:Zinc resistance-associated protein n=1 Tax=Sphingomonas sanxanigenens DSM 19645 = NX02 TaxID=1123269 RepID=W0AB18_9SPHN|nr:periplasmic heavy metal sensor [Sphingomonas sanxanigenens]AHE53488.1 hypothetical protein NX02_08825 [Sphingomonas sanxanigenens DSM 19645 = NX02]